MSVQQLSAALLRLDPGGDMDELEPSSSEQVTSASNASGPPQPPISCASNSYASGCRTDRTFYYVTAGSGCGIHQMQREGFRCIGMCEIDPYCRALLQHHFPSVPIHDDIRTLDLVAKCGQEHLDVVLVSTPCTDVSYRGKRLAQEGHVRRSALYTSSVGCRFEA